MTAAPLDFAESGKTPVAGCGAPPCDDGPVRHRRRGAALEHAIHDAVFEELAEIGYAALTIESIANRARTGKASIYRRWPTKQELVLDAFRSKFGEAYELIDSSLSRETTTRDALVQAGRHMCDVASGGAGEAIRAAACEISRDAVLAAALDEQVNCPKREALVGLLRRGVARGEVRAEAACDLIAEVLPSMLMSRLILRNLPVSDEYLVRVVDDVVMPLLQPA
jgi:AcrR family transcriptional regulator